MKPNDIQISHWTSKITGGHSLNVPAGIKVVHLPTGTVVCCDSERAQYRNRAIALASLEEKLTALNSELSEVITTADALVADSPESFEPAQGRVSRTLGPAPTHPIDPRNMAAGTHCWAIHAGKLIVVMKHIPFKGVEQFYIGGSWGTVLPETELTLLEVIARPAGYEDMENSYE